MDVCSESRLGHRAYGVLRASLGQNEGAHRKKQRWGCFFINNSWCDERNLHSIKSFCSPDLEFHMLLCQPFWLPREFTAIIITAVYIPPQANTDQALKELYGHISEQETVYPDAAFIVAGDFNKANLRTIAPRFFQHITINTCGDRALDHCYSPFWDAYRSFPRPPFGKSDHLSILLLPAYRQKLKREAPALREIQCWSDHSDAILQDCFDHVDWDMFRAASDDDIEAYSRHSYVFHQEVCRRRSADKNNPHLPQPKTMD
ncbi:dynein heavy chain [Labeo rohita]|uniref:Dynein heavy chain n=1 Tax=Labeo rohita TaxID=84645 RepID=A0A498M0P8_LABRO|nr:dynein heavy chain [Labeo rohita]